MNNLFDLIKGAQGGQGLDMLGQQFGLNNSQVKSALEALLPAFSMGLEKQAQNPMGMFEMFGKAAQGNFASMFEQGAPKEEAASAGNDILGSLFGSKEVSRAVAAQASAMSGVSDSILKAMLPAIASMLMGGLMKNFSNGQGGLFGNIIGSMFGGGQPQQNANGMGGLGDLLGQMMGGGQQQAQASGGGLGDILGQMMGNKAAPAGGGMPGGLPGGLGDLLGQMMGGGQQPQGGAQGGLPGGLGDLLDQMMGGGQSQQPQQPLNPADMFGDLFKSGARAQQQHLDGLQSIFDQFMGKR